MAAKKLWLPLTQLWNKYSHHLSVSSYEYPWVQTSFSFLEFHTLKKDAEK